MARKIFTLRVWIFVIFLVFSLMAINPRPWASGIEVKNVAENSLEADQGIAKGEKILAINNRPILTLLDYKEEIDKYKVSEKEIEITAGGETFVYNITGSIGFSVDENLTITEAEDFTRIKTGLKLEAINGEKIEDFDDVVDATKLFIQKKSIVVKTNKKEHAYLTAGEIGLRVGEVRKTNIQKGLELEGGTRVVLQPETNGTVTDKNINDLISVLENRLNVYGLADLKIRAASDLAGNKFVVVEIAGATREEVKELIGKQGKFEAKIGQDTVFIGGKGDVPFVCRDDGSCSGIIPPCTKISENNWNCEFRFTIKLSQDAAKRHADVTKDLEINSTITGSQYLSRTLDMYLDDRLVSSLQIGSDLRGREVTDIQIS
ncbi:MAG: hypothetical protein AABW87_00095, partial [Nanoarchaeota archaeon]